MEKEILIKNIATRFICYKEMVGRGFTGLNKDLKVTGVELKKLFAGEDPTESNPYIVKLTEEVLCNLYITQDGRIITSEIYNIPAKGKNREQLLQDLRL